MERMPDGDGAGTVDAATAHIQLVSLGHNCGPKLSFKHLGRGAETLPFDWIRTRLAGVFDFLRNDFAGFYTFTTREAVPGIPNMVMHRGPLHSFWHDDPTDPGMREKYGRRIERLQRISAHSQPVLFVRVAVTKLELRQVDELLEELQARFGKHSHLLLVLNFQEAAKGAAVVDGRSHLMVYMLEKEAHTLYKYTAYAEPIRTALGWMVGRPTQAMRFPNLEHLERVAKEISNGTEGLGGLRAFEDETCGGVPTGADAVQAVSLGCHWGPRLAMDQLRCRCEDMPFDRIWLSLDGLLHFLQTSFSGFFDHASRQPVPGQDGMVVYRDSVHSFWYDDIGSAEVRAAYKRRIEAFLRLDAAQSPIVFLRVASSPAEVAQMPRLLGELQGRFGAECYVLLVLDYQDIKGPGVVQGCPNLLVYFLEADPASTEPVAADEPHAGRRYAEPLRTALKWMVGEPFSAMSFPSLAAVEQFVADSMPCVGIGGVLAFDEAAPQSPCEAEVAEDAIAEPSPGGCIAA